MELKPGYKQTEVGILPEDWEVKPMRSVLTNGRLGGNYPNQIAEAEFPLMKMGNIARGHFDMSKVEYISPGTIPEDQHRLARGDVLFNTRNTLELVGKVAMWRDELPVAYYNSNLMRLEFKATEVASSEYGNYSLNTASSVSRLRALATGTTSVAAIYTRDLLDFALVVPPIPEQSAIAEVLGDVDDLLSGLDKLIAKKRDLKQAAMQQLITGKTRLPGFIGEWGVKRLGDMAHIKTGSRNNEEKVEGGEYPFFVRSSDVERINSYSHDCEAILVPGEGRIGEIFHYINGRFDVHQRVYAITHFAPEVSGKFIHLYMSVKFGDWAMQNSVKATVDSLRLPTFQNFQMHMPPTVEEQTSIAEMLSDMDAELAALEARRDKTHLLKQGMMQELLTGKTRLV
ncbi:restriction endonuclease subunit S [Burkholderia vietnamiensis]|uniref:restriction endonuclease subunit S n=1 Tax=Burkholderia vietnamiensis TaxID=60552 RepID=UPI001594AD43|nr:restriction endonuclease subunit S [Burkholderia vietnamiensis]